MNTTGFTEKATVTVDGVKMFLASPIKDYTMTLIGDDGVVVIGQEELHRLNDGTTIVRSRTDPRRQLRIRGPEGNLRPERWAGIYADNEAILATVTVEKRTR